HTVQRLLCPAWPLRPPGSTLFPYTTLFRSVEKSSKSQVVPKVSQQAYKLPESLAAPVKASIDEWRAAGKVRRLWQRDASLWTSTDRKSTRLNSSHVEISYAVFCLKKKKTQR